jgi:hypothetical protein
MTAVCCARKTDSTHLPRASHADGGVRLLAAPLHGKGHVLRDVAQRPEGLEQRPTALLPTMRPCRRHRCRCCCQVHGVCARVTSAACASDGFQRHVQVLVSPCSCAHPTPTPAWVDVGVHCRGGRHPPRCREPTLLPVVRGVDVGAVVQVPAVRGRLNGDKLLLSCLACSDQASKPTTALSSKGVTRSQCTSDQPAFSTPGTRPHHASNALMAFGWRHRGL